MPWASRFVVAAWLAACGQETTEPQRTPDVPVDVIAEDAEATQPPPVDVDSPTDVYVNAPDWEEPTGVGDVSPNPPDIAVELLYDIEKNCGDDPGVVDFDLAGDDPQCVLTLWNRGQTHIAIVRACVSGKGVETEIWARGDHFPSGSIVVKNKCTLSDGTISLLLGAGRGLRVALTRMDAGSPVDATIEIHIVSPEEKTLQIPVIGTAQ